MTDYKNFQETRIMKFWMNERYAAAAVIGYIQSELQLMGRQECRCPTKLIEHLQMKWIYNPNEVNSLFSIK